MSLPAVQKSGYAEEPMAITEYLQEACKSKLLLSYGHTVYHGILRYRDRKQPICSH